MKNHWSTPIGRLRLLGFAEGLSWLLLLGVAMPLKYLANEPLAVKIVGWIHGVLFMAYLLQLLIVHLKDKWPLKRTAVGVLAAFFPFGTWIFDSRLKKVDEAQINSDKQINF